MIPTKKVSPFVMTSDGKIVRIDSCVDDGMWLKASAGDVLEYTAYKLKSSTPMTRGKLY